jgi:hypothetical protein
MMKPCQKLYKKESTQESESERKRNKGATPKVQANKQPKIDGPPQGKGNTKNQTLLQSHEAYQLKKWQVNPIKLQAYKNSPH